MEAIITITNIDSYRTNGSHNYKIIYQNQLNKTNEESQNCATRSSHLFTAWDPVGGPSEGFHPTISFFYSSVAPMMVSFADFGPILAYL